MGTKVSEKEPMVFSAEELRKAIGYLGFALPFVLALGGLIIGTGLQSSISAYYHTCMRDVFVGTICVIGFFLLSYKGYDKRDNIAGDFACLFAVILALFPTAPEGEITSLVRIKGFIHLTFAGLFFGMPFILHWDYSPKQVRVKHLQQKS